MEVILATSNKAKIREIIQILGNDIDYKTMSDFPDWPDVEETEDTFKGNALLKSSVLAQRYNMPAIADDSGLVVEALDGEPGVHSSRYSGEGATDEKNMAKLLNNLQEEKNRKAAFKTVVVYKEPDGEEIIAAGEVEGRIVEAPVGGGGFGYDPVFVPDGFDKTFAQMSSQEKNELSHRGKAINNLRNILQQKGYF